MCWLILSKVIQFHLLSQKDFKLFINSLLSAGGSVRKACVWLRRDGCREGQPHSCFCAVAFSLFSFLSLCSKKFIVIGSLSFFFGLRVTGVQSSRQGESHPIPIIIGTHGTTDSDRRDGLPSYGSCYTNLHIIKTENQVANGKIGTGIVAAPLSTICKLF